MQINRLFEIVYILLNRKAITAKELAEHFEVSQRTIYRDIESLYCAGIPIYTNKGKNGGINLLENFTLNKSILSEDEQKEILTALQSLNATNYPCTKNILNKLTALFSYNNTPWIEIDFSNWNNNEKEKFNIIKESILNKKVLTFNYYNSMGEKTFRTVNPMQLYFKDKSWYLKSFCKSKNDLRIFKLNRMKKLNLTDESFTLDLSINNLDIDKKISSTELIGLKLKIDSTQSFRVYDEFEENQITKDSDDNFIVTISFPKGSWVTSYLLSFGCFIEVLEPLHIRNTIKEILEKSLKIYS